jgi:cullin 1
MASMWQLVVAVVTQLGYLFKADPKYIRKRINDLIDREFVSRDEDDPTQLHYIA